MGLSDYLGLLRRRFALVALIVLGTMTAALGLAIAKPPVYKSTARLRVRPVAPASDLGVFLKDNLAFQTSVLTEAELVKSASVANEVLRRVRGAAVDSAELLRSLEVFAVPNTEVLIVSVSRNEPARARDLANAFVDSYIDIRRRQAAQEAEEALFFVSEQLKTTEVRLTALDQQLRALADSPRFVEVKVERDNVAGQLTLRRGQRQALLERSALTIGVADVIEEASLPPRSGADLPRNGVLGFLIGIPLALGAVLLLDSSDTTLKNRSDAAAHTGTGVIGLVPRDSAWRDPHEARLVTAAEPLAPAAEAYRMAAVNVAPHLNGLHRILVTSPGESEGKSATAANLAVSFMEAGYHVALVSMDFRRPRLHSFFDAPGAPGVTEVVTGQVALEDSLVEPTKRLAILASGAVPKHPHRIVRDAVMDGLFSGMLSRVNGNGSRPKKGATSGSANGERTLVLIDAPATLEGAEVSTVAGLVDGVVLVVRANKTTRSAASQAAEQIRRSGGNLIGVVLVDAPAPGRGGETAADR